MGAKQSICKICSQSFQKKRFSKRVCPECTFINNSIHKITSYSEDEYTPLHKAGYHNLHISSVAKYITTQDLILIKYTDFYTLHTSEITNQCLIVPKGIYIVKFISNNQSLFFIPSTVEDLLKRQSPQNFMGFTSAMTERLLATQNFWWQDFKDQCISHIIFKTQ